MMVSFSGGKDSTVTSHIVNRALGTNKVLHIFGDTTLEFPYTLEYKKRFNKNQESQGIRVLTAKNRENFENLCEIVGPPSRVMRWCCTVFKTGAIQKTISSAFKDKDNILSFQGIRRNESASRSKYERESESPKISKQTVASPIIDWIDYDVWLYILTTGIDFNDAYRLGRELVVGVALIMVDGLSFCQKCICMINIYIGISCWWILQNKLVSLIQKIM